MGGKKSALEIRHDKGEKLTDDEIKELIKEIYNPLEHPHPLLRLYEGGYRLYHNDKNWNCHFCDEEINAHRGYWGLKSMHWSIGPKLCHKCFLNFLRIIEYNEYLMLLLGKIRGKELEILDWLASQDGSK